MGLNNGQPREVVLTNAIKIKEIHDCSTRSTKSGTKLCNCYRSINIQNSGTKELEENFEITYYKINKNLKQCNPKPCGNLLNEVIKCLNDNSKELLKCNQMINAYRNCVHAYSLKINNEKSAN